MTTETLPQADTAPEATSAAEDTSVHGEHTEERFDVDGALDDLSGLLSGESEQEPVERVEGEPAAEATTPEPDKQEDAQDTTQKVKVGEREFSLEELEKGVMLQSDYTKKTQQLAEKRKELEAWDGLIRQIQTNPALAEHIRKFGAPQEPQPPEETGDIIADLAAKAAYDAKQQVFTELDARDRQRRAAEHVQKFNAVKAQAESDPDYPAVMEAIVADLKQKPVALAQHEYQILDSNPDVFHQTFRFYKERITSAKETPPEAPKPKTDVTEQRTTKAPLLESGGRTVPTNEEAASKAKRLKEARKRIKNQTASPMEAIDYLDEIGALGDMLA